MGTDPTHVSVEPLLNDSLVTLGSSTNLGIVTVNSMGACLERTAVTVNATAQEITMTTGYRTIWMQNTGDVDIQIGGATVTTANGITLFPDQTFLFSNVRDDFSTYVISTAATSTLRIVEWT